MMGKKVIHPSPRLSLRLSPRHAHEHFLQADLVLAQLDQFGAAVDEDVRHNAVLDVRAGQGHLDLPIREARLGNLLPRLEKINGLGLLARNADRKSVVWGK